MKRGPDHSPKTAECNPSPAEVALGIPEIVANILHCYPRYGRRGQNNITTVSKFLNKAIKEVDFSDEPTFEKLIADCIKYPEGVIHILRDDTLLPYLSEVQLLKLISCHSEFAICLLENDIIPLLENRLIPLVENRIYLKNNALKQAILLILTKHHPQTAMHLFTNPNWRQRLEDMDVYTFGCQHPEIAQYILDHNLGNKYGESFRRAGLKRLAKSSVIIARRLLNDPATFRDLTEPNLNGPKFLYQYLELLIETAKTNESFRFLPSDINTPNDFINQFETLCERGLTAEEVKVLGEYHSEIAMKVLQSKTLCEKYFDQKSCLNWGKNHEAVAMHFLKTKSLCQKLDTDMVGDLCKNHPAAIKYALTVLDLSVQMYQKAFPSSSVFFPLDEVPMLILGNPTDINLHELNLVKFGENYPRAAKVILTTKDFYTKLSKEKIHSICHEHPHILRKILNTESLREVLEPEHLKTLESIDRQLPIKPFLINVSEQAKCWDLQTNKPREEMDVVAKSTLKK